MSDLRKKIEDMLSAITFSEEGEFGTAREIMKERDSMHTDSIS
jgi:hypothetical protein